MSRKRVVVKIGTSTLTRDGGHLDRTRMTHLVRDLATLHRQKVDVVLVSSGAIAAGIGELGWGKRPTELSRKQAAAAVGQPRLMEAYRTLFRRRGISVGQLLLTREDFENRARLHNAQATLGTLLDSRVIPIINENDTVAVDEIRVGDNDTLAARVAVALKADLLILLTDVDGLYTRPPHHGQGELIPVVERITPRIEALAQGAGSENGTGGMQTKLRAARLATARGTTMVIASGRKGGMLPRIFAGHRIGTRFLAHT